MMRMDEAYLHRNYYPVVAYYVRSPSSSSSSFSTEPSYLSYLIDNVSKRSQDVSAYILSRYSSSIGSTRTQSMQVDEMGVVKEGDEEEDEEEEVEKGMGKYFKFGTYPTCGWFLLQLGWRVLLGFLAFLLIFYVSTKPPPPHVSVQMKGVEELGIGEGMDNHGVLTKILNCNCTMELLIDNKSRLFGLHLSPPLLHLSFSRLSLASSQGSKLYARRHHISKYKLGVAASNKALYGAGPKMQGMFKSRKGLHLHLTLSFGSKFHVLGNIISQKLYHQANCHLVLHNYAYMHHNTLAYTSHCNILSA